MSTNINIRKKVSNIYVIFVSNIVGFIIISLISVIAINNLPNLSEIPYRFYYCPTLYNVIIL
jgi:hypothetical protein